MSTVHINIWNTDVLLGLEMLMRGLPECLCRSATAFRLFVCDLTRLELRLHGPDGRGRTGEDRPAPLRHGLQDQEPESPQCAEKQALLSPLLLGLMLSAGMSVISLEWGRIEPIVWLITG